jgi:hypothetical protein
MEEERMRNGDRQRCRPSDDPRKALGSDDT